MSRSPMTLSPRSTSARAALSLAALGALAAQASGQIQITEYMYSGNFEQHHLIDQQLMILSSNFQDTTFLTKALHLAAINQLIKITLLEK